MSTCNFSNNNASRIYAVEDIEGAEDWQAEDLKDNLYCELSKDKYSIDPRKCYDDLRSYPQTEVITLYRQKCWQAGYEATVYCTAIIRAGYYAGCNLDFEFEEDTSYNLSDLEEKRVNAFIEKAKIELAKKMEKVFKKYSTPLVKVATFSNGEAIYQKA